MKEYRLSSGVIEGGEISFVKPDEQLLSSLYSDLGKVADKLNSSLVEPQLPEYGFLSEPLTNAQQMMVNDVLEIEYATQAVKLQDNLTTISIEENNERMVSLPDIFAQHDVSLSLSEVPFNKACGEWGGKQRVFWARETVAEKIVRCGEALDLVGVTIRLEDAFRPLGVQEGLFLRRAKMILKEHPEWEDDFENVWTEARSKTAVTPNMAGHKSGAALDITLLKKADGLPLPLGNLYPEGGPKVALQYPYLTQEEWGTRQLFALTMEMGGLGVYPYENWHASSGDLSAGIDVFSHNAIRSGYTATYGPIQGFEFETGEIVPYSTDARDKPFYSHEELLTLLHEE